MPVGRFDDVELHFLAQGTKRGGELPDPGGGYSQSELNAMSSVLQTFRSASTRRPSRTAARVEIGERSRRVEVGVCVESADERVRLVAQVALDRKLRIGQGVPDVVGELQSAAELLAERLPERYVTWPTIRATPIPAFGARPVP